MKGWPPASVKKSSGKGHSVAGSDSGGLKPTEDRSGDSKNPSNVGTASDDVRFPTRELMPTKESNE